MNNNTISNSYKNTFSEIITNLSSFNFLFSCNVCRHFLFSSSNIKSIYLLKEKYFCYVLNDIDKLCPLQVVDSPSLEDIFLNQKDTYFNEVTCKSCGEIIGSFIIMSNFEKNFLSNSILVRNDKLISYKITEYSTVQHRFKVNSDLVEKNEEAEKCAQLNMNIIENFENLNKKMKYITKGKELFGNIQEIKDNLEKLTKIHQYLKYASLKNKQTV